MSGTANTVAHFGRRVGRARSDWERLGLGCAHSSYRYRTPDLEASTPCPERHTAILPTVLQSGQGQTMSQRDDKSPYGERCRSVLFAALLKDEMVIAEGRANDRDAGSGYLYLVVTDDRILWMDYVTPARISELAFADVTAFREEYESHRYFPSYASRARQTFGTGSEASRPVV
jgi:hypothetical protein